MLSPISLRLRVFLCSAFLLSSAWGQVGVSETGEPVLREDFLEVEAHIPAGPADLTCQFLGFQRFGPGRDQIKLSYHPHIENDPHYLWNGLCPGPVFLGFPFAHALDLTNASSFVQTRTKNVGGAALHLALQSGGRWYAQETPIAQNSDWTEEHVPLHNSVWLSMSAQRAALSDRPGELDWAAITGVGFLAPVKGGGSQACIRLDWFALHSTSAVLHEGAKYQDDSGPAVGPFIEPTMSFFRSALAIDGGANPNRTRRGVIVRCGPQTWACFDPDLLRWSAVWNTPEPDVAPITLDSMAGTSYPDGGLKADQPPGPVGSLTLSNQELPGINIGNRPIADPREAYLSDGSTPVGPLPPETGKFKSVVPSSRGVILNYSVGDDQFVELVEAGRTDQFFRHLISEEVTQTISVRLSGQVADVQGLSAFFANSPLPYLRIVTDSASGASVRLQTDADLGTWLHIPPGTGRAIRFIWTAQKGTELVPLKAPTIPETAASKTETVTSPKAGFPKGPFVVRNIRLLHNNRDKRAIRPTDIAFTKNGDAWLTTLDGDVWRIRGIENETAQWLRVASGLYEPTNVEIDSEDRIFVLGRDQVTQLVDSNGDGLIDRYECAADGFWQTLHTRDYAMSMVLEPDGAFVIAKGGIQASANRHSENATHRGAILRVLGHEPATVLADGLRLPFVGRRTDGALFASDQQGHWVPSSPLYAIGNNRPSFGFAPTRHRDSQEEPPPLAEPEVWFPYQANRSGAGFATLDARAFPDLPNQFVHIAWDGRLFAWGRPRPSQPLGLTGQPFGWRLPLQFEFPTINGATHPKSGTFYATGLGLKGYLPMTPRYAGLVAVRQAGPLVVPTQLTLLNGFVSVQFQDAVPTDVDVEFVSLRFWNLKRSANYGSGHYRWDGEPGEQSVRASRPTWANDRTGMGFTTPPLYRSDVAVLHLQVRRPDGQDYPLELYARPVHLPAGAPENFNPQYAPLPITGPGNAVLGKELFVRQACIGCHSLSGEPGVGPDLNGMVERHPESVDEHLRTSILKPNSTGTPGYPAAMPSYEGVITPQELEHLVAYLKSLK